MLFTVISGFELRKVEIISYQTENYTAIFNEILTCNNNALLSELMAFILYKNIYKITSPLQMGAPTYKN